MDNFSDLCADLVNDGTCERGNYQPGASGINLPVPSDSTLDDYNPTGIVLDEQHGPGILHKNIEMYGRSNPDTSYGIAARYFQNFTLNIV